MTPTIGLEIHAELKTQTKMFCDSKNHPDDAVPNTHVCPICMGHPGTLPTINKEAVRSVLRVGVALQSTLADYTEFDRKNYFYPDIPKGYQISQYKFPLVSGGVLNNVAITRVHLEEDTARSQHGEGETLIDYNRAGVPLMELVTEPVIHSGAEAASFARELQLLLRTLGVSDANLEKGEMRIEVNISVSPQEAGSSGQLGTKVEIKNINSFRSVERSIAYEIERQTKLIEKGEKVIQETRGWDEVKEVTIHQRIKEGSADYRYFPEPDLPKIIRSDIRELSESALKESIGELPWEKRTRLMHLGLKSSDAEFFVSEFEWGIFFDDVVKQLRNHKENILRAVNFLVTDVIGFLEGKKEHKLTSEAFSKLITMFGDEKLSSRGVKDILAILLKKGGDPERIAEEGGFIQVNDEEALGKTIDEVMGEHPLVVEEYRKGKESVLGFLVGTAMKKSGGSGNPQVFKKILIDKLKV